MTDLNAALTSNPQKLYLLLADSINAEWRHRGSRGGLQRRSSRFPGDTGWRRQLPAARKDGQPDAAIPKRSKDGLPADRHSRKIRTRAKAAT